ncbi:MAG: uracil-DNA glycosylase, partial [Bacteroidales bacterium]|nr:uracil-DNA glycosylase [Bacteroidales bacterium]
MESKINPVIHPTWKEELNEEFNRPYFHELKAFLVEEKKENIVFPSGKLIFNAFELTPFPNVKVVLLGQDPYHNVGQAHGLCFSVPEGIRFPKSLVNIFYELQNDLNIPIPRSGNLEKWARQGVLLLNATLTVRAHEAGSHQKRGWEQFTDKVISTISQKHNGIVFLLWGSYAQAKAELIDTSKHFILKTVHPSPLSASRGFFGCKHFSKTNNLLTEIG